MSNQQAITWNWNSDDQIPRHFLSVDWFMELYECLSMHDCIDCKYEYHLIDDIQWFTYSNLNDL